MRIPEHKIDEIRTAADISDIVADYVELKQRGVNYWGLCPFHSEKTPSFSVNPNIGIYKCFGCGKGGNAFVFLMDIEKIGFVEAVRTLADRYNISLPEQTVKEEERAGDNDDLLQALRFAGNLFYKELHEPGSGKPALDYLKKRALGDEILRSFAVGYALDSFRAFKEKAIAEGFTEESLLAAGLLSKNDKGETYDRFRNRIMFPLLGISGQVIGFGGRVMPDSDDKAKYVNSPETDVYHKSKFLYGLFQSKHEIRREGYAVVVEGYTDVMRLHEHDVKNVVASSGTSLTVDQVALLGRYAKKAVLVFDSDLAGIRATERAIDILLNAEMEIQCLVLPDGEDPDSIVQKHGGDYFKNLIRETAMDFVFFKTQVVHKELLNGSPEDKLNLARGLLESIAKIKHPITRDGYVEIAAQHLGVPATQLFSELRQLLGKMKSKKASKERWQQQQETPPTRPGQSEVAVYSKDPLPEEIQLIRLMLTKGPKIADLILRNMSIEEFTAGPSRTCVVEIVKMRQNGEYDINRFVSDGIDSEIREFVTGMLVPKMVLSHRWAEKLKSSVETMDQDPIKSSISAMMLLKSDIVKGMIKEQKEKVQTAQERGEDDKDLIAQLTHLNDQKLLIQKSENYI